MLPHDMKYPSSRDSCFFVTGRKLTLATNMKLAEVEMIVFYVSGAIRGHTVLNSYSVEAKDLWINIMSLQFLGLTKTNSS
jgi:hypothetical protein